MQQSWSQASGQGEDQPLAGVWETPVPGPIQQVGKEWRALIASGNFSLWGVWVLKKEIDIYSQLFSSLSSRHFVIDIVLN